MTRSLFGGILDEAITHGFSQRRPIRSVQIPPELGKSPTDFTDIHRFFLGLFFCHADFADDADFSLCGLFRPTDFTDDTDFSLCGLFCHADFADDADFFSWDFFHRMTRNLFGGIPAEAINHGFSRRRPVRSVQIPPELGKSPTKKNLCISVKSVGQNNPHKEKSVYICEICGTK